MALIFIGMISCLIWIMRKDLAKPIHLLVEDDSNSPCQSSSLNICPYDIGHAQLMYDVPLLFVRYSRPGSSKHFIMLSSHISQLLNMEQSSPGFDKWRSKTLSMMLNGMMKAYIYLASVTTCWARLKLYSILEQVNRNVLYYDTDSMIYLSKPGEYDPPLGDYLGEIINELKTGEYIVEFVSGGPKNYAYKTNRGNETCKVRGFTLHFTNSKLINFESVKAMVLDPSEENITVTNPQKRCRDKRKRKLYNREEEKNYQMVYTKH